MDYISSLRSVIGSRKIILNCAGAVIARDGRIRLQRRSDNGLWGLVGGLLELDETYAEAAVRYGRLTKAQGLSLLASAVENLNAGCVCQISEIADGDAPHAQKGCRAQAWSVSELLRVWLAL